MSTSHVEIYALAQRLAAVSESSTLKMAAAARELAQKGVKVYNFAAGEPDFPLPAVIAKALIESVEKGHNKYTPVPGIPELRTAIAEKLKKENALSYEAQNIVVSTGAKQAIFNFLLAVINPGDEVLIPSPYWVSYPEMVKIAGGTPVILKTGPSSGYKLTPEMLKAAINPRTKVLILNSPSNPAGVVYTRSEMQALARQLEGSKILVLSDEIYEKLVYEGEFVSFGAVSADAFARTVTINGFSKAYCMTGLRLGYAAGPKSIIDAMGVLQGQSTSGATSVVQRAALAALKMTDADLLPMKQAFERRRNKMMEIFAQCSHLSFIAPAGAFYLFLNIEKLLGTQYNHDQIIANSDDLALFFLNAAHISSVAGDGFGHGEFIRLSFAASDEDVEAGAKKLVQTVNELMRR
jgi:aspartate aminotransferase